MGTFTLIVAALLLIAIVAVIVVALRARRGGGSGAVPRLVRIGALIGAVVTGLIGLVAVVTVVSGGPVTMTVPVQGFLPMLSPGISDVDGPSATITGGPGFTEGDFAIEGLDPAARAWLVAGTLVHTAVIVTILLLIARLAGQAQDETPFARSTSTLLGRGGALLAIGGIVWQICFAIAGLLASHQALFVQGFAIDDAGVLDRNERLGLEPSGLPSPGGEITIDFWPVGVGLVLVVLAVLLRQAERLQRDTAGLV